MNKNFKYYVAIWAILFVMFNAIVFIVTDNTIGLGSTGGSFWVAYVCIICSFVAQLICAKNAFSGDSKKLFYGIPLIQVSNSGLIVMTVVGTVIMAINSIPSWIGAVICILISGFDAIAIVKAKAVSDIVSNRDEDIRQKTAFIREMTAEAEVLYKNASTPEEKRELKKLYEAFRYSDSVSNSGFSDIEEEIRNQFSNLNNGFSAKDINDLLHLLNNRNLRMREKK